MGEENQKGKERILEDEKNVFDTKLLKDAMLYLICMWESFEVRGEIIKAVGRKIA